MRENNNFIKLVLLSLVYLLILLFLIHIIRDIYKWKKSYYIEIKVQMTIILNFFSFYAIIIMKQIQTLTIASV